MISFLERLKAELDESADWNETITVSRKDLEKLIRAYENSLAKNEKKTGS